MNTFIRQFFGTRWTIFWLHSHPGRTWSRCLCDDAHKLVVSLVWELPAVSLWPLFVPAAVELSALPLQNTIITETDYVYLNAVINIGLQGSLPTNADEFLWEHTIFFFFSCQEITVSKWQGTIINRGRVSGKKDNTRDLRWKTQRI